MRAFLSHRPGGPDTLELDDVECPSPAPHQLLIRTAAVALNYLDCLVIEDRYQVKPPRPFAPGCELAGTVASVGAQVSAFVPGDRVFATTEFGALAQFAVADSSRSFLIPDDMPFHIAAALPVTYGTAFHALKTRAQLEENETLLVLGASGGAGTAAIQLGKALGATVVAAVSSEAKAAAARHSGADRTVIYPETALAEDTQKGLAYAFKSAVGKAGANVVFDPVGGNYCEPALRALAWHGRYLIIGFAAGIPTVPLNLVLLRECVLSGVFWGESIKRQPEMFPGQLRVIIDLWRRGLVRPQISGRFPLAKLPEALALMSDRSAVGKIVVDVPSYDPRKE